jgi:hypothetical protein
MHLSVSHFRSFLTADTKVIIDHFVILMILKDLWDHFMSFAYLSHEHVSNF